MSFDQKVALAAGCPNINGAQVQRHMPTSQQQAPKGLTPFAQPPMMMSPPPGQPPVNMYGQGKGQLQQGQGHHQGQPQHGQGQPQNGYGGNNIGRHGMDQYGQIHHDPRQPKQHDPPHLQQGAGGVPTPGDPRFVPRGGAPRRRFSPGPSKGGGMNRKGDT